MGISLGRVNVVRIIIELSSSGNDLAGRFVKALNLLNENGVTLRSGTQLVSRYAVIVADHPTKVLEHLPAGNIAAFPEREFPYRGATWLEGGLSRPINKTHWFASRRGPKSSG